MVQPELSAVVIVPDRYETVERVMRHLHGQTVRARMEVLFCVPEAGMLGEARPEWGDFFAVRVVETGPITVIAQAKAMAVREARGVVVAFTEEHAFPASDWGEMLLARHQEDYAVVGPGLANPNPGVMSWANFLVEYGPWLAPAKAERRRHLPGNNSSYKREVLLGFGDQLAAVLDAEWVLHEELSQRGMGLFLETRAVTWHFNMSELTAFRTVHREYSRMFAAQRCRGWAGWKKVGYLLGSPLIPVVRLRRLWGDLWRVAGVPRGDVRFWWYLGLALVDSAWGECLGYALGAGQSRERVFELEFHRERWVNAADRRVLEGR